MPVPWCCPRADCVHHHSPKAGWRVRYGYYRSVAHGRVQRYRCRGCGHTLSDQSESLHYYAKRHLPLRALWLSVLGGSSLREVARRYLISPQAVQNAVLRLGRQAMAAQLRLLEALRPCSVVLYDGLRSCVSSQDYPCELVTVVEPRGEMILSITHTITRRAGRMRAAQRRRVQRKERVWRPEDGAMKAAISLVHRELWSYLRPSGRAAAEIHTDEHPLYRSLLARDAVARHWRAAGLLEHRRTPGSAPRTVDNRLFAVNYIERLLRHRLKEHTRESIAIGRQATMQMHRAWMFAYDHNGSREYRVKQPSLGGHAEQGAVETAVIREVNRQFFRRRIAVRSREIPETLRRVWMAELPTPPLRWRVGQRGSSVRVPAYAIRDLFACYQHAA